VDVNWQIESRFHDNPCTLKWTSTSCSSSCGYFATGCFIYSALAYGHQPDCNTRFILLCVLGSQFSAQFPIPPTWKPADHMEQHFAVHWKSISNKRVDVPVKRNIPAQKEITTRCYTLPPRITQIYGIVSKLKTSEIIDSVNRAGYGDKRSRY
jgi:hypothetical protein